jgi:hypothetical protein
MTVQSVLEQKKLWYSPVPLALAFEPINLCNAKCFCCPYTEFSTDKTFITQKMSVEQITSMVEDWVRVLKKHNIKPKNAAMLPWRYSDPLVNPHLGTVLELADKHGLKVALTTNAVSFGKKQCDLLQKYIHTLNKIFVSVIGFTEQEVKEQMGISKKKTLQSLKFVRDNYPQISQLLEVAIKNKSQTLPSHHTIEEYQKRLVSPGHAKGKGNWMSNRLGKGDDVWSPTPKKPWKPSEKSFVNGCNLTAGKILNRLEIMVSGRAALCCDMSYDRNFPKEKVDYGNVFEIGIEGIWANLTKEHQLIYDQKFSDGKKKLICNDCNRAGINTNNWTLSRTVRRQRRQRTKFFPEYSSQ